MCSRTCQALTCDTARQQTAMAESCGGRDDGNTQTPTAGHEGNSCTDIASCLENETSNCDRVEASKVKTGDASSHRIHYIISLHTAKNATACHNAPCHGRHNTMSRKELHHVTEDTAPCHSRHFSVTVGNASCHYMHKIMS